MGGKSTNSSTQTQKSTTAPWAPTQPLLEGILGRLNGGLASTGLTGAENGALGATEANAGNYDQFSPMIVDAIKGYLGGGGATNQAPALQSNYDAYKGTLTPYATGSMVGANSGSSRISTRYRAIRRARSTGMFAGSGRDMSGLNQQALARGCPASARVANRYSADVDRAVNAASSLYGQAATSGLLRAWAAGARTRSGHRLGSISASSQNAGANAILAAEAQRRGIPLQTLTCWPIGVPVAGLGRQSSGTAVAGPKTR